LLLLEIDEMPKYSPELSQVRLGERALFFPFTLSSVLETSELVREVRRNDRETDSVRPIVGLGQAKLGCLAGFTTGRWLLSMRIWLVRWKVLG